MGIGYNAVGTFGNMFAVQTQKPIVGSVASGEEGIEQGIYNITDTNADRVLGGGYIQVDFQNGSAGLNPLTFNIKAKATAVANVDAVLLWSGTDMTALQGSVPVTEKGLMANFARLHSRVGVWMKVHSNNTSDLQTATISQALTIDTTNGGVKKSTGQADVLAGAVMGSQIIQGQEIVWDTGKGIFMPKDCSVVLVYLY